MFYNILRRRIHKALRRATCARRALQIPSLPFTDYGNTCCMADNYTPCVGADSREVVYNYYLAGLARNVTVSLCGSSYDTGSGNLRRLLPEHRAADCLQRR
jgi:hypothetical protein